MLYDGIVSKGNKDATHGKFLCVTWDVTLPIYKPRVG